MGSVSGATGSVGMGFDGVYASEFAGVARLAFLMVGSRAVAEELAQDAFVQLFRRYDTVKNPAAFLRTVVVRVAINWLRRAGMERDRLARATAGIDHPVEAPEIDEMWSALTRLRPERRVVLVLRFYEQMHHGEIAALLGCSPATIRSRTRRALEDLRKELER